MSSRNKRITTVTALFLVFAVLQVYVVTSFAEPSSGHGAVAATAPQQLSGILTTRRSKPVEVNGASAITGATILPGAVIETPQEVGATVNLGALGQLDISPKTSLKLDFSAGNVKVTLFKGCVILFTKKGTTGTIENEKNVVVAGPTDPSKDGKLDVCSDGAGGVIFGQAAAAGAGAGAAAAAGGLLGLGVAATVAIVGGVIAAVVIPIATRGTNPSASSP